MNWRQGWVRAPEIEGNDIFNGWNLSVGDSTPKGQSAVWFTLRKNSPVRRGPGSWYGERNEVIQVAVALYSILKENGILAFNFNMEKIKALMTEK